MGGVLTSIDKLPLSAHILFSRAGLSTAILVEAQRVSEQGKVSIEVTRQDSPTTASGFLLMDAGDGVLRDLVEFMESRQMDKPMDFFKEELLGITISHGHFDHIGGLWSLLGFLRMIGRLKPLPIFIPKGSEEPDGLIRLFRRQYPTLPFEIDLHEVQDGDTVELDGLYLLFRHVCHSGSVRGRVLPRLPAFGVSVEYGGQRIAFSGDTGDCPALRQLVTGADLAIIEATFDNDPDDPEILERVHLSVPRAEEIGGLAKDFVLMHRGH